MVKETNIFIVGIKGVAMANLAVILKKMGKKVIGSDVNEEFITDELLKKNNIDWINGFSASDLLKETELVIYGAAHGGINNPQVKLAQKRGVKVISQAEFLGELSRLFDTTIAVCGCHGKTTTASILAYSLINLGVKPSYLVGSSGFNQFSGGDYSGSQYFVVEADEYGINPPMNKTPKFHLLKPEYAICTNIDYDHPDVYGNIEETVQAFKKFFEQVENNIFVCIDDDQLSVLIKKFDQKNYFSFGFNHKADFWVTNYSTYNDHTEFELKINHKGLNVNNPKGLKLKFGVGIFGEKNIGNVAGVIAFLLVQGFKPEKITQAIKGFTGPTRRFEKISYLNDIYLFDDYAHHPQEIKATINAARDRFPQRRIVIIFQPHTFSRTQALLTDFTNSLSLADVGLILPIFPSARENHLHFKINAQDIIGDKSNLFYVASVTQLINQLSQLLKPGDIVFTMGAGDVYKLKDDIINIIKSKFKSQKSK